MNIFPFKQISLRQKLLVILVLFILSPLATAGVFFYISSEKYTQERTNKETLQTLHLLQQNVDQLLNGYENKLMTIYQNEQFIKDLRLEAAPETMMTTDPGMKESLNHYLYEFIRDNADIDSLYLFPDHSQHVYFYDNKGSKLFLKEYNSHPEWMSKLNESKGKAIWFSTYSLAPNEYFAYNTYYFMTGIRVKDVLNQLQPLGSLLVNIKVDAISRLVDRVQVSPNGFILITGPQGDVIWHRNEEMLGTNVADLDFYRKMAEHPEGSFDEKLNGIGYHIMSLESDYNHWQYISFVPIKDLNAETANIKRFTGFVLLVSVILFSLLAALTTLYVTRPLRRMVIAMNRVDKDNFRLEVKADSRDEIGILQNTFNNMNVRIRNLID